MHGLDVSRPSHLWLLHELFTSLINNDCAAFQEEWNHHPVAGKKTHGKSPLDLRFLGETMHGLSRREYFEDVHPDTLARYLSAGHPSDESSSEESDAFSSAESNNEQTDFDDNLGELKADIARDLQENVNHHPVKVPQADNPFKFKQFYRLFKQTLEELQEHDFIPSHLGLTCDEWPEGIYPTHVKLTFGWKSKVAVHLPHEIWFAQAKLWGQELYVLNFLSESNQSPGCSTLTRTSAATSVLHLTSGASFLEPWTGPT
ncbi:hypothetical protein JB92DRAFT_3124289 [Gautieria morchelliformis]|nr:hypothetical protein JB92DRAFT_3124289 [Gautieria morchelliformis]